jgi:N-acetyl-alpha-D-glucosaminyl L-malate synthase BshA
MSRGVARKIGMVCFPTVGGSGTVASALGDELAKRGHEVHFISHDRPFRMPAESERVRFHRVEVCGYELFRHPDYLTPLAVAMAKVSAQHALDVLHVHYAAPHAIAAQLAMAMLPAHQRPAVVVTLHGSDVNMLGTDPAHAPAIRHALECADAITAVSESLRAQAQRAFSLRRPIDVVHNFFEPGSPGRPREAVRRALGVGDEVVVLHHSNLRPVKRFDLLLGAVSRVRSKRPFRLVVAGADDLAPYDDIVRRLGLEGRVVVHPREGAIEDLLAAADLGLFTSESESFCLSILELMGFGCPSVSTAVGGIPEVVENGVSGLLVPFGDADALVRAVERLIDDTALRHSLGGAAQQRARERFSAEVIVPRYTEIYRRLVRTQPTK